MPLSGREFRALDERMREAGVPADGDRELTFDDLTELGCSRESAIYVGDSEVDIQTARNCAMSFIGVSWGFRGRERLLAIAPQAIVVDKAEEILREKKLQIVR